MMVMRFLCLCALCATAQSQWQHLFGSYYEQRTVILNATWAGEVVSLRRVVRWGTVDWELCTDDIAWAPRCQSYRSQSLCYGDGYAPGWNNVENLTINGISAQEGCCACGRDFNINGTTIGSSLETWLLQYAQYAPNITAILLANAQLEGPLPDAMGSLRALISLDVAYNQLTGDIWEAVCGMRNLQFLRIGSNSFTGALPDAIGNLSALGALGMWQVGATGTIPEAVRGLTSLQYWWMQYNAIRGTLPDGIASLRRLRAWDMSDYAELWPHSIRVNGNDFRGALPDGIASLSHLYFWDLLGNAFEGQLPNSIGSLSLLEEWKVSLNRFEGAIPDSIASLSHLHTWWMIDNAFAGQLPDGIGNLSAPLRDWRFDRTAFVGTLPGAIFRLVELGWFLRDRTLDLQATPLLTGTLPAALWLRTDLQFIQASRTRLSGTLPDQLGGLTLLIQLLLDETEIGGSIPSSVERLTDLELWYQGNGRLSGSLPSGISAMKKLRVLRLNENPELAGSFPGAIAGCSSLEELNLAGTRLSGALPDALAALTALHRLALRDTRMSGTLPDAVASMTQLLLLDMKGTALAGTLPAALALGNGSLLLGDTKVWGSLPTAIFALSHLDLSYTLVAGSLPSPPIVLGSAFGSLPLWERNLAVVQLQGARLTGEIPQSFFHQLPLEELYLQDNAISGSLPSWPSERDEVLHRLRVLDLSRNRISGRISSPFLTTDSDGRTRYMEAPLREVRLEGNQLSGSLSEWGALRSTLLIVDVSNNDLSGDLRALLDPSVGFDGHELHLHGNPGLYGQLPDLRDRSNLQVFDAAGCSFRAIAQMPTSLLRLDMASNELTEVPADISELPFLEYLDVSDNDIVAVQASRPPPLLAEANFNNNSRLRSIGREWLNERGSYSLRRLHLLNIPSFRMPFMSPARCKFGAAAISSANPDAYQHASDDDPYECTLPCTRLLELSFEPGVVDPGALCRCRSGFGLLPGHCWDKHFRYNWGNASSNSSDVEGTPSSFETCFDVSSDPSGSIGCAHSPQASQPCCECGGAGAGGNGMECWECPNETYAYSEPADESRWRSVCQPCPAGATTFGPQKSSVCDCHCPVNTYLDLGPALGGQQLCDRTAQPTAASHTFTGDEACTPCSFLRITRGIGALSEAECECDILGVQDLIIGSNGECACDQNQHLNHVALACEDCADDGEDCAWIPPRKNLTDSIWAPDLLPGFWAATGHLAGVTDTVGKLKNFSRHSIYKCFSPAVCVDRYGNCSEGREGIACSLCKPGFAGPPGGACRRCEGSVVAGLVLLLAASPLVVLAAHALLSGESSMRGVLAALRSFRVSVRQLIKHLQVVSVLSGFTIAWPADIEDVFAAINIVDFNFIDAAGLSCLGRQQTASLDLGLRYAYPSAFILLGIFITPIIAAPVSKLLTCIPAEQVRRVGANMRMSLNGATRAVYWIAVLFFPTFLQNGLRLFTCNVHPNQEITVATFPHLHCLGSKSGADDEWLQLLPAGIAYTALCLGCCIGGYIYVYRRTWQTMEASNFQTRGKYEFLFEDFRDSAVHWPVMLLCRDAYVNAVGAVLNNYGSSQLLLVAAGMLIFGFLCIKQNPYADASNTMVEVVNAVFVFAICMFTAGMGFTQAPGLDDMATLAKRQSSERGDNIMTTRASILLGLQLASLTGPFLIIAYQLLLLVPIVTRNLPDCIRPLQEADREALWSYLREKLHIAEGDKVNARNVDIMLSRLDVQEMQQLVNVLIASPAASKGILRDPGTSTSVEKLLKHATSWTTRTTSNPSLRGAIVHPKESADGDEERDDDVEHGEDQEERIRLLQKEKDEKAAEVQQMLQLLRRISNHAAQLPSDLAEATVKTLEETLTQHQADVDEREEVVPEPSEEEEASASRWTVMDF